MSTSIPKVIHYCWFGRGPLPELAQKCIESWKRFFADYEIREWNEDNYDVNKIAYTRDAYEAKKYAFVSDYARFDILYQHGGIYFDTDVEVIRDFSDVLARGAFLGCERDGENIAVAAGLGMAAPAGLPFYKEMLQLYARTPFEMASGSGKFETIVTLTTRALKLHGLLPVGTIQQVAGVTIYPACYFAPKDIDTKELRITPETRSIHHYDASWAEWYDRRAGERGPKLNKLLGKRLGSFVNVLIYVLQKYTFRQLVRKCISKLNHSRP